MLKRCSPRSRTSAVSANGSASSSVAPLFPVKNAASSWSVPRATVPSTSGRALEVSRKNMLSRSGIAFGWLCMSCRHPPRAARTPSAMTAHGTRHTANASLRRNVVHLARFEALEKVPCPLAIELRVRRFDQEEELVPARALEPRHVEHRVIRHRQLVEHDHPDDRGQRGKEDCQLEDDPA